MKAIRRLGEKGTDGQEIILQRAIIVKQHPGYSAKEIISYAGKIREVVETFRATHTPHHATTIRATAEYSMYFARYNNQEARRQMETLEREASVYLREGHPLLAYIARLRSGWDDLVFPDFGTLTISTGT